MYHWKKRIQASNNILKSFSNTVGATLKKDAEVCLVVFRTFSVTKRETITWSFSMYGCKD